MGFPRMRVFAGPNGSGKTTILNNLKSEIPFGVYVNADDIQLLLQESKVLLFSSFQINVLNEKLQSFFKKSSFAPVKRNDSNLWEKLEVCKNILKVNTTIDSYLAADLADFIRKELVEARISFTFETVMSHQSKIDFMKTSKAAGYKVYLYYVSTEDFLINISRVNLRVAQNGHYVAPNTIETRYFKSLNYLANALSESDDACLWDNSGSVSRYFCNVTNGANVVIVDDEYVPNWFSKYVINKIKK